ncbi:MAG TPA: winged helix family transcriptional regulator [Sulfurovum sp.]|nr:winged helix family transcriptional regulator [Sulfurovum sp.]
MTYMIKHRGRAISSDELIQNLWTYEDMPSDATLRVYIKTLRQAIGKDTITTIRGVGYTLG